MNDSAHPGAIPGSRLGGRLYAAQSSRCEDAVLALDAFGTLRLETAADESAQFFQTSSTTLDAAQICWQDRVGNIPLRLHLPDGRLFETNDFAAADGLRRSLRNPASGQPGQPTSSRHLLQRLENWRWRYLLGLFLLTLGLTASTLYWGLPWVADKSVQFVPLAWEKAIGAGVMDTLDHGIIMEKSRLSDARQADIRAAFDSLLAQQPPPDFDLRLYFRHSNTLGANAFALPGGHVIITDDLVRLADNMDEIVGVLAHELGHVHHRHGMRHLARASSYSFVTLLTLGDATSLINDLAASGVFFMQMSYSRTFEYEADRHSVALMHAAGRNPLALAHMLERLEAHHRPKREPSQNSSADGQNPSDTLPRWLSTHPPTPERVRAIRAQAAALGVTD